MAGGNTPKLSTTYGYEAPPGPRAEDKEKS